MIKKFCTKHGIEYIGDSCPECNNPESTVEKPKKEKKKKHKNVKPIKKRVVSDEDIDEKLKALIDKWNDKD